LLPVSKLPAASIKLMVNVLKEMMLYHPHLKLLLLLQLVTLPLLTDSLEES
jgi:hypothetical protein